MPVADLPHDVSLIILVCNIVDLLAFMLLCCSYLIVFHIYFTILIAMFPFVSINMVPEMAFPHFGVVLMHPALILIVTTNLYLVIRVGVTEIVASLTIFNSVMCENLRTLDDNTFVEKLVEASVSCILAVLIRFVVVFVRLSHINKELACTQKVPEDRLDQQKNLCF